ncbi:MAG: nodulation protein NfeD [Acidobacteriota bacterium]
MAAEFIETSVLEAEEMGAAALLLELDTPGGLLESTRRISETMLAARLPVIVFVGPSGARAASAGFFLLMSADVAVMAPGTHTGAAHPVGGQGQTIEGDLGEKVEQDAAASIRALAGQRGRNVEAAESAVLESKSFTAEEALELGLIDLVATDPRDLLARIDGREIERPGGEVVVLSTAEGLIVERRMPALQRFLAALAHPHLAGILMALGMLGLYMELTNPGAIFPGVLGAISLILAFYAMSILPLNYAGIALILLALILFIAETQVPTFGLLTTGGAIALILGSVMLFKDIDPAFQIDMRLILGTSLGIVAAGAVLTAKALSVRRRKVLTGREGLVGSRGVARTEIAPRGKIFVHGELWAAEAETPVAVGSQVVVVSVDGLKLHVESLSTEPAERPLPVESELQTL